MENNINSEQAQNSSKFESLIKKAYSETRKKDFTEINKSRLDFALNFRGFYPFISIASAYGVGAGLGHIVSNSPAFVGFEWWFNVIGLASFFGFLAMIAENFKKDFAKDFFTFGLSGFGLVLCFVVSVVISGTGGYVGNHLLNDPTDAIKQEYNVLNDSISSEINEQIAVYDAVIESNKKRLKLGGWSEYHAGKDIETAQNAKNELIKMRSSAISENKTEQKAEISTAQKFLQYKGYLWTLVFVVLECLFLLSFWFESYVYKGVKIDNEKIYKLNIEIMTIQKLLSASNQKIIPIGTSGSFEISTETGNQVIPETDTNIGFSFGTRQPEPTYKKPNSVQNGTGGKTSVCQNPKCNKVFTARAGKKYCTNSGKGNCKSQVNNKK